MDTGRAAHSAGEEIPAPVPAPGPGEVLIRVYAASVNPVDWKIRRGGYASRDKLPITMGRDASGMVRCDGAACELASDLGPGSPYL